MTETEELKKIVEEVERLKSNVAELYRKTRYEDLEHAELGFEIVEHALGEVIEHTGKGGTIKSAADPQALKIALELKNDLSELQEKATNLLTIHSEDEDLQTGIKALELCKGSFEEVIERYSG
jgi:prefoldin subunit 5